MHLNKKKVFVLDIFTNGHEAALKLIAEQGWSENEHEIVFGGSHEVVLEKLSRETSYAVVPIKNSIVGNIREVTEKLFEVQQRSNIRTIGVLELKVDHCLLAKDDFNYKEELLYVISHPKAIEQCQGFLESVQAINPNKITLVFVNSTGAATKRVNESETKSRVAAIASKMAAENYGLKILAENIQDDPNNTTTFALLSSVI